MNCVNSSTILKLYTVDLCSKQETGINILFWLDIQYLNRPKFSISALKHTLDAKTVLCPELCGLIYCMTNTLKNTLNV